jgi:hypothetical protein
MTSNNNGLFHLKRKHFNPDSVEIYGGLAGTETGTITQVVLNNRDFTTK